MPLDASTAGVLLTAETGPFSLLSDRFFQIAALEGYWHVRADSWASEGDALPTNLAPLASIDVGPATALYAVDDALVLLRRGDQHVGVTAAGTEIEDAEAAIEWMREVLPETEAAERQEVTFRFVSLADGGPSITRRPLAVPRWEELAGNYSARCRRQLEELVAWRPERDGAPRLLVWHGPPGTGKTHALRALAWEWRTWCDVGYIVDPDAFLSRPAYMLDTLPSADRPRWRLLVLEDTGELMRADARERVGQGLSRMLNLVDGLLGQGLPLLVLITTNEPFGALHEAVTRPGRCAADVHFEALPAELAAGWLLEHGHDAIHREMTLAQCYAVLAGEPPPARRVVGFAP